MQSEGGVAGGLHGAAYSGCLSSTFTCSQGLLLMIPNMYLLAVEHSPAVIHVATRTIHKQALSLFSDHSDVIAVRQCGGACFARQTHNKCMTWRSFRICRLYKAQFHSCIFFDGF
jgi:pyruvate-ferredoxin/flavodoxin oxidoreductase